MSVETMVKSVLLRMYEDLDRALKKPVHERH